MFPARSDFSSPVAYSAWWYQTEGAGRRRVCATDGSGLVGDLTDFIRQMTWEWGTPDGNFTLARMGRVGSSTVPPPIAGTTRVPPVPQEVVAQLQREARAFAAEVQEVVAMQGSQVLLRYMQAIEGRTGAYFSGVISNAREFLNADPALRQQVAALVLARQATHGTEALPEGARMFRELVRLGFAETGGRARVALTGILSGLQEDMGGLSWSMTAADSAAIAAEARATLVRLGRLSDQARMLVGSNAEGQGFSWVLSRLPGRVLQNIQTDANAARIIAEAEVASQMGLAAARGQNVTNVMAAIDRAAAASSRLGWLARMRGFFRGMAGGFAIDMPRSGWAFSPSELATDQRWDGVFQSAIAAYLRVTLGGSARFSTDVDENRRLTLAWWHGLSPAWNAVYSQLVDDYNNRAVSITSVYVATWMLSNVHSLATEWRNVITDPRQARGFVGLDDIGVPADAVMPPWNTPLRSACVVCPLTCAYDNTTTTQPTSILPAGNPRALQIHESAIRISLADAPGTFGERPQAPASAIAKELLSSSSGVAPYVVVGTVAAVLGVAYATAWLLSRPRSPALRR